MSATATLSGQGQRATEIAPLPGAKSLDRLAQPAFLRAFVLQVPTFAAPELELGRSSAPGVLCIL